SAARGQLKSLLRSVNQVILMFEQRWRTGKAEDAAKRVKAVQEDAKCRDDHSCVITCNSAVQAAHTLPHCLQRKNSRPREDREYFWDLLTSFWGKDKVDQWKYAAFGDPDALHGDETEQNIITLDATLHQHWNGAGFALKPSLTVWSDDDETIEQQNVEFLY